MAELPAELHQDYYQQFYAFEGRSAWMEKIWSEAFGDAYPEGLEHYGYVTMHDLRRLAESLNASDGAQLLDIGCGRGGPGLQLASQLQLHLTGIDIAPGAIAGAEKLQERFALKYPARFEIGHFFDIPAPEAHFDAVMSIDALWTVTDKLKALTEVKRVMKPGARFVFTQWDLKAVDPITLLEHSGLKMISREETPGWKETQTKVYEGILTNQEALKAEMGPAAEILINEANAVIPVIEHSIRRLYVMELPA